MEYPNATLLSDDWVPRLCDGGYDMLISSVAPRGLSGNLLLTAIDEIGFQVTSWPMVAQYVADRQMTGALNNVDVRDGPNVSGVKRGSAPTGIGTDDGAGIWFSEPSTGAETVRWYVNGEKKIEREQDLAKDRSATLKELDASRGDVVQVCVVADDGIVGWWGRIEV